MKNKLRLKKGFTIIELIVVIAILGILVLLAMWGYKGYVEKAKLVQIKHDVKVAEQLLAGEYLTKNTSLPDNWVGTNPQNSVNNIYDTRGPVNHDDVEPGDYKLFPKDEIGSKLPGDFHAKDDGKVYYEDSNNKTTEDKPIQDDEIADLIDEGFIPVANADELQQINDTSDNMKIWGAGTKFETTHIGGLDQKYVQIKNIDLSEYDNWLPIGFYPSSPFNGIYNGGNYLIDNLNIEEDTGFYSAGLFGSVSNGNVIISNIKMRNVNVSINKNSSMLIGDTGIDGETTLNIMNIDIEGNISGSSNSGGLVGFVYPDTTIGTIKDITIKGDISSTDSLAGGIIGEVYTNIDTIENILIESNVSGSESSGGLIGFISWDNTTTTTIGTIKDITIKSDISSTDSLAGGIIGEAYTNIDTIKNILIESNVSGSESSGGLIGFIGGDDTAIGTIKDITIKGNILNTDTDNQYVGGLLGEAYTNIDTIENILIESNVSGSGGSGGLIGLISGDDTTIGTIKDITIKGNILNTDTDSYYVSVGGIIGQTHTNIDTIENISIESIIKGKSVGGLIGLGTLQLSNAYDVKIINSEINGIENSGGLFGSLYNSAFIDKVLIKDTVIKSDSSHSGGLVGEIVKLIASDITIENSNITGALSTGGIAGAILADYSLSGVNIDKNTTINGFGVGNEGTGGIGGKVESTTSILDINISADITGVDNVGELYGWAGSRGEGIIEDYHFDGTINGTGNNVGGPYGYIDDMPE